MRERKVSIEKVEGLKKTKLTTPVLSEAGRRREHD